MRPLLMNFSGAWGGLEMTTATVFRRLLERGVDVHVVARPDSPIARQVASVGGGERLIAVNARKYLDRGVLRAVRGAIRERELDLVHTFWSADLFHAAQALVGLGRVGLVHHLQMLPGHSRKDPLRRLLYARIDRLLVLTRQMESHVHRFWPVKPERVRTLYYGLDPGGRTREDGGRRDARERLGLETDGLVLGLVGQVCELKGQRFLLEVFAEMQRELADAQLVFVGAPVPGELGYARDLQRRIRELGLSERVHDLGFRDDVPEIMPAFDVFVLGSRNEPFGLVVIEAMLAGCLVVASAAGGVPEIVDDGVDGFLYEPRSAPALKATLRELLARPSAELDAVRRAAQEKVARRFVAERFTTELIQVYREVLGERLGAPSLGARP